MRFDIVTRSDPQALIRLLNHFAQCSLVPSAVTASEADGRLTVRIEQPDVEEKYAALIAERMRNSVLVETVSLQQGAAA
ncbi:hypothetical protein [Sphingobium amiense]|uniref:hypothetical protein n=1 Tax=Sphingobium amiense TaxID=135719 RepID=UPI0008356595|nr:hypothetical protein [Sphingobium amiense]